MVRRTKADAELTRETILDAAELLFAERGIEQTSLEDIAKAAGVTRGAVYWHFENKYALFTDIHTRAKLPLDQMMEAASETGSPLQSLEETCVYALKQMTTDARMQRVFSVLLFSCEQTSNIQCAFDRQRQCRDDAIAKFEKIFKAAKRKGELAAGLTPRLAACALISYMGGLFADYLRLGENCPISKQAKPLMKIFFNGLKA